MKATIRTLTAAMLALTVSALGACSFSGGTTSAQLGGSAESASLAATTNGGDIEAFDAPDGAVVETFSTTTEYGSPRTFLVVDNDGDWLKVLLPTRPNSSMGFIRAADVSTSEVRHHIFVDRESNTLRVEEDGEVIVQASVADGSEQYPTPTGSFFVTDVLDTPDPDGAYGPFAVGISGYSEVLSEFNGSDGQVGIHGTNDPDSIGKDVSHGCIRLDNDTITELAGLISLGTPVTIV